MFPRKLCCAPSLSQSAGNSSMCSSVGFTPVQDWFVIGVLQPGLLRGGGIVKCYGVHLRSESCCQAGTVTAKILQLHLHQPVNSFWKGQNTENSES